MKPGRGVVQKKKLPLPSEALEAESKRMEERLIELREHMKVETERRKSEARFKDGSRWRSGLTTRPMKGYANSVLSAKPKPRPASKGFVPSSELLNFDGKTDPADPRPAATIKRANTIPKPLTVSSDVLSFLQSCGLEKHFEAFLTNGVDEMEVMLELTEEHLTNIGLPLGHRIKLLKRIRDAKAAPQHDLVPLPGPQLDTEESATGGALLRGDYNEPESRAMFREALDEFRKGGTTTHHQSSPKQPAREPRQRPSVSKEVTDKPKTTIVRPRPIVASNTDEGLMPMSIPEGLMKEGLRDSCWECYRIFSEGETFGNKNFCSKECVDAFKGKLFITCECGKVFTKLDGELKDRKWYCSEQCVPRTPTPEVSDDEEFFPIDPVTGDPITP